MTFYVVHKLKVKNPQSLTEGQVSESARLFKTSKANLFHRIAATYRDQIDRSIEVGDLVSDSESELRYWQLVFDISSTKENEEAIFERLDWIDNHIVDIVSSLQGVVFEPKLNSIHRIGALHLRNRNSPTVLPPSCCSEWAIDQSHPLLASGMNRAACLQFRTPNR